MRALRARMRRAATHRSHPGRCRASDSSAPLRGGSGDGQQRVSHSVGQNCFHLIWKPKWAKDPFKFFSVRSVCTAAIRRAAVRAGMRIIELEVMPDHVHCFVDLPSTMSVAAALQRLKGYSAYMIFRHHPWLRRHFRTGHLWSPGKFFRSAGSVTADAIQHYIAESNRGSREQKLLTRYPALKGGEIHSGSSFSLVLGEGG